VCFSSLPPLGVIWRSICLCWYRWWWHHWLFSLPLPSTFWHHRFPSAHSTANLISDKMHGTLARISYSSSYWSSRLKERCMVFECCFRGLMCRCLGRHWRVSFLLRVSPSNHWLWPECPDFDQKARNLSHFLPLIIPSRTFSP